MRSKEFIKEAGRNGSMDDSGMPINQPLDPKEFPPLKIGQVDNSRWGKGRTILSATTSGDGTVWRSADGQIWSVKYGPMPPEQQAQPEITIPQTNRTLIDPRTLDQPAPAYVDRIPAVKPVEPAYVDRIPAVKPVEPAPAPVQSADPVPSFRVPGAAQDGQGGTNYTTGVAQDRPHQPDAGADETTRNDYPFVPYTGPEPKPKPNVKPIPSPTPVPRRKVPKSVVQVSPDKQNLATTKTTLTPDEIKAAQEALRDPTIGPRDKAYYTELLKNQPASPATQAKPTGTSAYDGTQKFYRPSPSTNATPAVGSVVIKPGDTLSKIAAANGTTVPAIMALNPSITNADRIAAGQTVKLRESSDIARIRHLAGLTRN
jgi:LysM repeat protein